MRRLRFGVRLARMSEHSSDKLAGELRALADAGIGEGDFDDDHGVPADLVELHEVLEWQAATGDDA